MIHFSADIRQAQACSDDAITTSSVGIPVELNLASDFNGLSKTVVFRNGSASADIALVGDATETTVPVNVLGTTGQLHIGIYAADGNGNIVIPTVWAMAGIVKQGVVPSGVDPSDPVPNWVAQVQGMASDSLENSQEAIATANDAKSAAITAQDSAQNSANAAAISANAASQSSTNAYNYSVNAAGSASDAYASAQDAEQSAKRAEQAANTAGWLDVEIDENGHLIYTKTYDVDFDFELVDGHLILEAV